MLLKPSRLTVVCFDTAARCATGLHGRAPALNTVYWFRGLAPGQCYIETQGFTEDINVLALGEDCKRLEWKEWIHPEGRFLDRFTLRLAPSQSAGMPLRTKSIVEYSGRMKCDWPQLIEALANGPYEVEK